MIVSLSWIVELSCIASAFRGSISLQMLCTGGDAAAALQIMLSKTKRRKKNVE